MTVRWRRGATESIASKQNAEHVWEPKFLAEIMAGRDPHVAPGVPKTAVGVTVADFLDLYFMNAIPGKHAKDAENRRIPFGPQGRLAPILKRRASLGPSAFVFGSPAGAYADSFKTAWESLLLVGTDTTPSARNPVLASIARRSDRLTCTGTTSVTMAPAGS